MSETGWPHLATNFSGSDFGYPLLLAGRMLLLFWENLPVPIGFRLGQNLCKEEAVRIWNESCLESWNERFFYDWIQCSKNKDLKQRMREKI